MALDNSSRIFFLRSEVKFGFWDGTTEPTAFYGPINFTKMEITTPEQEMIRLLSNMDGTFGSLLDSQQTVNGPATISVEFNSMSGNMLSFLLGATTADLAQTTADITDEAITPAEGVWQKLANQFIEPHGTGTEILFETAGDVEVPLVNFELDLVNGMYRSLNATGDTATKVSYSTSDRSGEIYNAGLAQDQYVMLVGNTTEKVTNKKVGIQIHKAKLVPASTFDPVANQYVTGMLEGDLLVPSGYSSAWQMSYTDLSA